MNAKPTILAFQDHTPDIDPTAVIMPGAVVIGRVRIGPQSSIWPGVVLRGDINTIDIGARTNIQDGTVVHVTRPEFAQDGDGSTWIGDDVTIGHGAVIHACRLEHKSFVGMGATVMDATVVQTHAMVAAGAMVPYRKTIASGEIWAGNPASFFRKLSDEEIQYIQTSAQHYVADAKAYRLD